MDSGQKEMVHTLILFFFLMFPPYLKAQDEEVYGFEFQDNKVPKYLTEKNGVAEVRMQVQGKGILIKEYSFTFD